MFRTMPGLPGAWYGVSDGLSYTRALEPYSAPVTTGCSTCYVTRSHYVYTRTILQPATLLPPPPAYTADWKSSVADWLKARDDTAGYLQTLKIAGVSLPIDQGPVPYGTAYISQGYRAGAYNLNSAGVNASTIWTYGARDSYGLDLSKAVQVYDQSNLGVALQGYNRGLDNTAKLHGQALDGIRELAEAIATGNAQSAEIISRGIAAAEALRAARGPNVQQTITSQSNVQSGLQTQPLPPPAPPMPPAEPGDQSSVPASPGADLVAWTAISGARCSRCHSGESPKGKFLISDFPAMSDADRAVVFERITSADAATRMPKDAAPLTPAERALFFRVRGSVTATK